MSVGRGASETGRRRRRMAPALTVVAIAVLVGAGIAVAPRVRDGIAAGRIVSWLDGKQELAAIDIGALEDRPGVWRALAARVRRRPDAICLPDRRIFVGLREQEILVAVDEESGGGLRTFAGNPLDVAWRRGEPWRFRSVRVDIDDQPEVVLDDGTIWGSSIVMGLVRPPRGPINMTAATLNPQLLRAILRAQGGKSRSSTR